MADEAPHDFGGWVVDETATCFRDGLRHRECTVCKQELSESVSSSTVSHVYDTDWAVDSTHHFHGCLNEGCTHQADKAQHSFDSRGLCVCGEGSDRVLSFVWQNGGYAVTGVKVWIEDVVVPSTYKGCPVVAIADRGFKSSSIRSLVLPDSVTYIGEDAFGGCHVESITLGNNVTFIGKGAFGATCLESIVISGNNLAIADYAFEFCGLLKTATIKDGVTSIGKSAFGWCTQLTTVHIARSVTSIGESAFEICEKLTDIYFDGTTEEWKAIPKGAYWSSFTPKGLVIHCSNGNLTARD